MARKKTAKKTRCQHEFKAVDFDDVSSDKIICQKCGKIKTCDHRAGDYLENPSGCCFCRFCGKFTGLAH